MSLTQKHEHYLETLIFFYIMQCTNMKLLTFYLTKDVILTPFCHQGFSVTSMNKHAQVES